MSKQLINIADTIQLLTSLGSKVGLSASGNMFGYTWRIETRYLFNIAVGDEFDVREEPDTAYSQVTYYKARRSQYRGKQPTPGNGARFSKRSGPHNTRPKDRPHGAAANHQGVR